MLMAEATTESLNTVLPKEVVIEILSRVESSNPLQLRCVCKFWNSLVLDRQFAEKYLLKSLTDSAVLYDKAREDYDAFKWQQIINNLFMLQQQEDGYDEDAEEASEEEEEEDHDGDGDDEEDEIGDEEDESKQSLMNAFAQLDAFLGNVRSLKEEMETNNLGMQMQAVEDRLKGLKSFLQVYFKSPTSSSSQL